MALSNYERLMRLAEETFAVKSDPSQLDVDPHVLEELKKLHPATISGYADENGPVAWALVIPTTTDLMAKFLKNEISEKELFELTPRNAKYDALYLCSALVLEEYRRKGIARRLVLDALEHIQRKHPIKALFVWAFTPEGDMTAEAIAKQAGLPLYKRKKK